jgi:hypothetical protein
MFAFTLGFKACRLNNFPPIRVLERGKGAPAHLGAREGTGGVTNPRTLSGSGICFKMTPVQILAFLNRQGKGNEARATARTGAAPRARVGLRLRALMPRKDWLRALRKKDGAMGLSSNHSMSPLRSSEIFQHDEFRSMR